jgi:imidazolonepropionase-like amidohydrolase
MLVESGASLLVGTDRLPWGFAFHWELEELSEAGIGAGRLLQAATVVAAEYLGPGEEIGTIEVGKRADLVLLSADPLEDIRNARRVHAVISNGIVYGRSQLDSMIDAACEALSS